MRFDLFDHGSYEKYAKLNRWLISMLAVKYNVYNTYKTLHLFSQKQLSVAIKNKYLNVKITIRRQKVVEPTLPVIDSKKEANAGLIQIYVKNLKNIGFGVG